MKKYITSIEDLVYSRLTDEIGSGDAASSFQLGMVALLGIDKSVDFKRAKQLFSSNFLQTDPSAKQILGFISECEGDLSSAFKFYALSSELLHKKDDSSQLQKIISGRDDLMKTFKEMGLPMVFNDCVTNILTETNKGSAKSKLNSKIVLASLCDDKTLCMEVAQDLIKSRDYYTSYLFLINSSVDKDSSLYEQISNKYKNLKIKNDLKKDVLIELEDTSILPNYVKDLSLSQIKSKCDKSSKSGMKKWCTENKNNIDKLIKAHKREEAQQEKEKKEVHRDALALWIVKPAILFVVGFIYSYYKDMDPVYFVPLFSVIFYYGVVICFKFFKK